GLYSGRGYKPTLNGGDFHFPNNPCSGQLWKTFVITVENYKNIPSYPHRFWVFHIPGSAVFGKGKYFNTLNCRLLRKSNGRLLRPPNVKPRLIFHSAKVFEAFLRNTKLKIYVLKFLFVFLRLSNIFILRIGGGYTVFC